MVSLIHDAQEIAILNGKEILNLESLNEAYQKRLSLLHGFIHPEQKKQTSKTKRKVSAVDVKTSTERKSSRKLGDEKINDGELSNEEFSIADLVTTAKDENEDIVQLLKVHMPIVEVAV